MTDGKSFFRGGTESNTRMSTFIGKKTVPTLSRSMTSYQKIHGNKGGVTPSKRVNSVENQKAVSQILPPVTNGTNTETPAKQADRRTDSLTHLPSVQPAGLPRLDLDFTERELTRLATFLDDSIIKVPEANKAEEPDLTTEANKPKRTFYVEKWPEPVVKLDNTIVPLKRTVSSKTTTSFGLVGGNPITVELAKELRMIVSGSTIHSLSMEWKKASFIFQNLDSPFSYGLVTPKGSGARGITLAVQAHCLQHLLYQTDTDPDDLSNLRPSGPKRRGALVRAICDMLWRAGQGVESQVCLSQPDSAFPAQPGYREDGITEKLHMFTFRSYGDLESFIKRYLDHFSRDFGCLLFLYSLVLSRGITRISDDQGQRTGGVEKLLTDMEGCSLSLVNLLVTGQAVRFLHNGLAVYDEFGHMLPTPQKGVQERCPVGFLFLDKSERSECRTQVGTMLKTPRFPIWLTMVNGVMGLLFSTNPELVRHWRVEHRFTLYYYTGQPSHQRQTCLSIDTRFNKRGRVKTALARRDTEDKAPPLETCILTKWYDAEIKWNGTTPFY